MNKYHHVISNINGVPVDGEDQITTATESDINAIEQKIGATLPGDYREFLRDYGMFSLSSVIVPVKGGEVLVESDDTEYIGVDVFYSAISNHAYGLLENYVTYQEFEQRMPSRLLPIADVGSGSQICLSIGDAPPNLISGAVYFWDRFGGTPNIEYNTDYSNVHFIASTFDEFMHLLTVEK